MRFRPWASSATISQAEMEGMKSWGLWHFSTRPVQICGMVRGAWVLVEGEGLMGWVLAR